MADGCITGSPVQRTRWKQPSSPNGECLVKAPHDAPATIVCECDLGRIEWSRTRWPFFRDRRIDAYDDLLKRWSS
jgi:N-carbamoylputrescine amidase